MKKYTISELEKGVAVGPKNPIGSVKKLAM